MPPNPILGLILPFIDPFLPGDTPNKLKIKNHREPGLIKRGAFAEKISLAKVDTEYRVDAAWFLRLI